ncbi:MAG: MarR family winged helix-turn-helix transcriptional regulator [Parashewanella sp.]
MTIKNDADLSDNVCFAVYSASNAIVRAYRPLLEEYELTYPQYLVMQALWCQNEISMTKLSEFTRLDLGTLTPIVKRLENKNFLSRMKDKHDARKKVISVTKLGRNIERSATELKQKLMNSVDLSNEDFELLRTMCLKVVAELK